jgi:hypothetical protein
MVSILTSFLRKKCVESRRLSKKYLGAYTFASSIDWFSPPSINFAGVWRSRKPDLCVEFMNKSNVSKRFC